MPGLENLPNELLLRILRELIAIENDASLPPAAPNAPEPTLSYRFGDGIRYGPFKSCWSMCLVFKAINPAATQVLYESILLGGNEDRAAALVCTLLTSPKHAALVQNLHIALPEEDSARNGHSGVSEYSRALSTEELHKRDLEGPNDEPDGKRLEDSPDGQLMLCLLSLSNLKSLGLEVFVSGCTLPMRYAERTGPQFLFDLIMRQQVLWTELSPANRSVLDNLKSLKLNCAHDPFATLSRDLLTVFKLENLESLELSNFVSYNANALETTLRRANITSHNLKELAMFDCRWRARDLEVLGAVLPNLQSLKWVLMEDQDTIPDPKSHMFPDGLNPNVVLRAFKPCRKVLKKLTLCNLSALYDLEKACKHHTLNGVDLATHAQQTQWTLDRTCDFSRFPALHTLTANAAYAFAICDLWNATAPTRRFPVSLTCLVLRHPASARRWSSRHLLESESSQAHCGILMVDLLETALKLASGLNNLRDVLIEVPVPRPGVEWPACPTYSKYNIYNHCERFPIVHASIIGHPDWLHDSWDAARPDFYERYRAREALVIADKSESQKASDINDASQGGSRDGDVESGGQAENDASSDSVESGKGWSIAGFVEPTVEDNHAGSNNVDNATDASIDNEEVGSKDKVNNGNYDSDWETDHEGSDEVVDTMREPEEANNHRISDNVKNETEKPVDDGDNDSSSDDEFYDALSGLEDLQIK